MPLQRNLFLIALDSYLGMAGQLKFGSRQMSREELPVGVVNSLPLSWGRIFLPFCVRGR